jgi:hypothetical protein
VIFENDEKAGDLPVLNQIPQMLNAGWGGTGIVRHHRSAALAQRPHSHASLGGLAKGLGASLSTRWKYSDLDDEIPLDVGSKNTTQNDKIKTIKNAKTPEKFVQGLFDRFMKNSMEMNMPISLSELEDLGVGSHIKDLVLEMVSKGYNERLLVIAFLHELSESNLSNLFERNLRRNILKFWKENTPGMLFNQEMKKALKDVNPLAWR